jgi:hypothetical protein
LLKIITTKLNIPLILVGDLNQNICNFQESNNNFLLNHSKKQFNLIKNYRSTNQIINFCNYIKPTNYLSNIENNMKLINGPLPLIYCHSIDNILIHIKNELLNNEYKLHEIAIIGPVKISTLSEYQPHTYKSISLELICNYLNQHNINFFKYYKDKDNNYDENINIKENHVNILSTYDSKGLEFKKVLVINYHYTTFSKIPTENEYNDFKYLWYTTFTRAINELIIYVDKNKKIFPEINKIPKENYIHNGLSFNHININFNNQKNISSSRDDIAIGTVNFNIENIINNDLYNFKNFDYSIDDSINLYTIENSNIINFNIYSDLYSNLYSEYIKKLFIFYYYKNNNNIETFINIYKQKINNFILISNDYLNIINSLQYKGLISLSKNLLVLNISNINKLDLSENEYNFILYCKKKINCNINYITIILENNLHEYDSIKLIEMYESLNNSIIQNVEEIIFKIVLYYYQIENECIHLLNHNFNENINSMKEYFNKINELSKNKNNLEFQVKTFNNHINIYGTIDILDNNNNIIELIFTKNINIKNILKLLLINNNYYFNKNMELWNLYDGKKYIIHFNDNILKFNYYLCDILKTKMNHNIFILDIETNTINEKIDFTEPSNTEIIDRYVYEYNFNISVSDGLIKNKYTLTTSHINGITNNDLNNSDKDLNKFKNDINIIMKYCNKPLFIAHNGNNFDFKILYYHNILNRDEILTLDTLYLFRLFIKEKNISNKLINLYNNICNKNIIQVHRAKEDTILIVEIIKKLNLSINQLFSLK